MTRPRDHVMGKSRRNKYLAKARLLISLLLDHWHRSPESYPGPCVRLCLTTARLESF